MDLGLQGKTALITGGSGGIGRGLVLEYAREGINVLSASRDKETGHALASEAIELGLPGRGLAAADMLSQKWGSIINISSIFSLLGEATANIVHYGGVKGFVNSFSKGLAWE